MTYEQEQRLREALLEAEASSLRMLATQRQNAIIEQSADEVEDALSAAARETAVENSVRCSIRLRQVRDALRRMDQGQFGVSSRCGEEIHIRRLTVLPWATSCVACQEGMDRREQASANKRQRVA